MNTNQWVAFRALRSEVNAPGHPPHIVSESRSPISVRRYCSCGWRVQMSRHQNALARASKLDAAVRSHFEYVLAKRQQSTPGSSS